MGKRKYSLSFCIAIETLRFDKINKYGELDELQFNNCGLFSKLQTDPVTGHYFESNYPSVAVAPDGSVHVIYTNHQYPYGIGGQNIYMRRDVRYIYSLNAGESWRRHDGSPIVGTQSAHDPYDYGGSRLSEFNSFDTNFWNGPTNCRGAWGANILALNDSVHIAYNVLGDSPSIPSGIRYVKIDRTTGSIAKHISPNQQVSEGINPVFGFGMHVGFSHDPASGRLFLTGDVFGRSIDVRLSVDSGASWKHCNSNLQHSLATGHIWFATSVYSGVSNNNQILSMSTDYSSGSFVPVFHRTGANCL